MYCSQWRGVPVMGEIYLVVNSKVALLDFINWRHHSNTSEIKLTTLISHVIVGQDRITKLLDICQRACSKGVLKEELALRIASRHVNFCNVYPLSILVAYSSKLLPSGCCIFICSSDSDRLSLISQAVVGKITMWSHYSKRV